MFRLEANLVLDNNGSFGDTLGSLIRFVESEGRKAEGFAPGLGG